MYRNCAVLIVVGIIIGLATAVDRETLPTNASATITKPAEDIPMLKKPNLATNISSKRSACTIYCDPDGHCQSEEFYKCIQKQRDVNFGLSGRQRTAFNENVRVQADTTAY